MLSVSPFRLTPNAVLADCDELNCSPVSNKSKVVREATLVTDPWVKLTHSVYKANL